MKSSTQKAPISVVVPMRNASTTILFTLKSIIEQEYAIREIIVVDNASQDNSVQLVRDVIRKSSVPIKLITQHANKGLGFSLNEGLQKANSPLVVFMHSDCVLPTVHEIRKLVEPFEKDTMIVASYPTITLSSETWNKYSFWEKCFFARQVDKKIAGFTTKFDCVRKEAYLKVNGFDTQNFGLGGEDADLHARLRTVGRVVISRATVGHLHFLGAEYTLSQYLDKQRLYAKTYGRLLRSKGLSTLRDAPVLLIKPVLAIIPFLPFFHKVGLLLLGLYAFLYTRRMFLTWSTLKDAKILLLPFINIYIVYFETFWVIESFLFGKNKVE